MTTTSTRSPAGPAPSCTAPQARSDPASDGSAAGVTVSGEEVRRALREGREVALVDVRPEGRFADGHPLFATSLPLDRLELGLPDRIPRPDTTIVVYGHGEDDVAAGVDRLVALGYTHVARLDGGLEGWTAGGGELFRDVNAPSKAFGELVAETLVTPSVGPHELRRMLDDHADVVVLDARRADEHRTMRIPGATSVPGAGLVGHVAGLDDDPDRLVVVNCAGRTRSIIGAQSLLNAGVAPRVVALRNGTIGWTLAGLALDEGAPSQGVGTVGTHSDRAGERAGVDGARERAAAAARAVADRAGVGRLDSIGLRALLASDRTVYRFDVRSPDDYACGHLAGFLSAPGGQLVQETDRYAPVRGATIVLVDDRGCEASMTGSWLAQMGWTVLCLGDVRAAEGGETGPSHPNQPPMPPIRWLAADDVAAGLEQATVGVIDVDLSARYRSGHIPGAVWARRSDLAAGRWPEGPVAPTVVVTSHDDGLTALAVADLAGRLTTPVVGLRGGTPGWVAAGRPVVTGRGSLPGDVDDVYRRPYEGTDVDPAAMRAYLDWELGLVAQLGRDGTHNFTVLGAPPFP